MVERRILTVVGARPQFVKAAMLSRALAAAGLREMLVHTGQHYDEAMSGAFFRDLRLPDPVLNLHVGSGPHGAQTARMLEGLERCMQELNPDAVVVFGDTNSTLAGALAAAKLGIRLAHVEAGMRCGDRRMPEEINRVLTDRIADLLLCATPGAVANLQREGATPSDIHLVGDLMIDACLAFAPADPIPLLAPYGVHPGRFVFATIHRAENTDDPERLRALIAALVTAAEREPVILCAHPRTSACIRTLAIPTGGLRLHGPTDYRTSLALCAAARVVATDSGGVQKEAAVLGTPVVVLRKHSEWTELVESGWCRLAPDASHLPELIMAAQAPPTAKPTAPAAARTITDLLDHG
jgi:UDP-GlcNAc3NAcA epimerase